MDGWTVTIEAAGTEPAALDDYEDRIHGLTAALADHGGAVSFATDASRYSATFSLEDDPLVTDALTAFVVGSETFRAAAVQADLPAWPIVHADVMTFAEHDAELDRAVIPELVGVAEISDMLGVTRARASQIQTSAAFPSPVAVLRSGPVWTRPSIANFLETWQRKSGRPRKNPTHILDFKLSETDLSAPPFNGRWPHPRDMFQYMHDGPGNRVVSVSVSEADDLIRIEVEE